jgi:hypothetical protein
MKTSFRSHSKRRASPSPRLSPYQEVILSPLRLRSLTQRGYIGRKTPHFLETGPHEPVVKWNCQSEGVYEERRKELVALKQEFSLVLEEKQQLLKSLSLKTSKILPNSYASDLAIEIEDLYSLLSSSHSSITQLQDRHSALAAEVHRVKQETTFQQYKIQEEADMMALKASMVGPT